MAVMAHHVPAPASSEASATPAFQPYVPASQAPAEFTLKAVVIGVLFGLLFGASTVYLGLRAGLTVSASIPIAVLAISILKRLGGSTILENNIVQTIGSAGESIASGVVFTLPALLFLLPYGPSYFAYLQITMCAFAGGVLGVLMMVPLRRALIVKEHGALPYPEGTACADVLVAGEQGGNMAKTVFMGLGVGAAWKGLSWIVQLTRTAIGYTMARGSFFPNATINVDISPEYMGVGYVIGPRIAGVMFAGGVLSWLVLLPLFTMMGEYMTAPFPPVPASGKMLSAMTAGEIWRAYIRYTGAGAVLASGIITLARTLPTIVSSFRDSVKDLRGGSGGGRSRRLAHLARFLCGGLRRMAAGACFAAAFESEDRRVLRPGVAGAPRARLDQPLYDLELGAQHLGRRGTAHHRRVVFARLAGPGQRSALRRGHRGRRLRME
jgi:putative OPT family oligopeptide transporter